MFNYEGILLILSEYSNMMLHLLTFIIGPIKLVESIMNVIGENTPSSYYESA